MRWIGRSLLLTAALASCSAPPAPRPQSVVPQPLTVAPPPVSEVTPTSSDAVEVGEWRYSGGTARFGGGDPALLTITCQASERAIVVRVAEPAASLTLRATTSLKQIPATGGIARLDPRDPILDALAFSRGRFGVGSRWYPVWPEVARVVEDCRG